MHYFSPRWRRQLAAFCLVAALPATSRNAAAQDMLTEKPGASPSASASFEATPAPAPPSGEPGKRYVPPKILHRVPIAYPVLANLNRIEGIVHVRLSVDETGHVTDALAVRTNESLLLDEMAGDPRLRQWTFQPATLNGVAVPATFEQEFEFRLDPVEQRAIALRRLALPLGTPDPPYPDGARAYKLHGDAQIMVRWSSQGLVDKILLIRSTNNLLLDTAAVRFAYEHWRIDPTKVTDKPFVKTVRFVPPPDTAGQPAGTPSAPEPKPGS